MALFDAAWQPTKIVSSARLPCHTFRFTRSRCRCNSNCRAHTWRKRQARRTDDRRRRIKARTGVVWRRSGQRRSLVQSTGTGARPAMCAETVQRSTVPAVRARQGASHGIVLLQLQAILRRQGNECRLQSLKLVWFRLVFSSLRKQIVFKIFYRILRHMYKALNIDENKN